MLDNVWKWWNRFVECETAWISPCKTASKVSSIKQPGLFAYKCEYINNLVHTYMHDPSWIRGPWVLRHWDQYPRRPNSKQPVGQDGVGGGAYSMGLRNARKHLHLRFTYSPLQLLPSRSTEQSGQGCPQRHTSSLPQGNCRPNTSNSLMSWNFFVPPSIASWEIENSVWLLADDDEGGRHWFEFRLMNLS